MPDKSPKTIATINFKGGVGKTTVTWCLGDVLSSMSNQNVLMFDLDAQMSLTQAIALNEDTGHLLDKFGIWYETAIKRKKTIFDALDAFPGDDDRLYFGQRRGNGHRHFDGGYYRSEPGGGWSSLRAGGRHGRRNCHFSDLGCLPTHAILPFAGNPKARCHAAVATS